MNSDLARSLDTLGGEIADVNVYSLVSRESLEDEANSIFLPGAQSPNASSQ